MSTVKIKIINDPPYGFTLGLVYESNINTNNSNLYQFTNDLGCVVDIYVDYRLSRGDIELVTDSNSPPELEVGMRVTISDKLYLVMPDVFISSNGGYISRSTTLTNPIEHIYTWPMSPSSALEPNTTGELLWKRTPPPKKVTMQEVCEKFGCEVEITQ